MLKNEFNTGNPVWVPLGGWQKNVFLKQTYSVEPTSVFESHCQIQIALTVRLWFWSFGSLVKKKNLKTSDTCICQDRLVSGLSD